MALAHFRVTLAKKTKKAKVGATVHKGASNTPQSIFFSFSVAAVSLASSPKTVH